MKLSLLPPSPRALKVIALKNYLGLECEMHIVDLERGDQLTPEYIAMNPNQKMPVLEDDGYVLWESNAILFYLTSKKPDSGLWPSDVKRQADVLRWLAWESAHWDSESVGMVGYEKISKRVLGLGLADPAFIARGEQNFDRFAPVPEPASQGPHVANRKRPHDRGLLGWWNDFRCGAPGTPDDEVSRDLTLV
jgi:glutathione S-transferase